jgi:hypothetical protein
LEGLTVRPLWIAAGIVALSTIPALAHSWYSQKQDPVYGNGCCGGYDCAELILAPHNYKVEEKGVRIILSLEEAKKINPQTHWPVDALVTWERVQPSEDGNWHACLFTHDRTAPRGGVICLFMPPNG